MRSANVQARLAALWQRGRWGKIAVGFLLFMVLCCACTAVGAVMNIINPPRQTASQATAAPAATSAPVAEAATAAPEPTSVPAAPTAAPEPTQIPPTAVPTAEPATATPAPTEAPTVVPPTAAPVRERGVMVREDLGDDWPLSVDAIRLRCVNGREVVFDAEGTTYALNGTARGTKKYAEIDSIWLDDPRYPGLKISVRPLLDAGLALCG